MLEVSARDFIDWNLESICESLLERGGMLCAWADDLIEFDSEASRARVLKRVAKFRFQAQ